MNNAFILLLMIFLHIVDDYKLQGILASMKQKSWWISNPDYKDMYKYDYIVALIVHSFSWAFMIMLPIAIFVQNLSIDWLFILVFIFNATIHALIDEMKANRKWINLVKDQLFHLVQIVMTFCMFATV